MSLQTLEQVEALLNELLASEQLPSVREHLGMALDQVEAAKNITYLASKKQQVLSKLNETRKTVDGLRKK